MKPTITLCLVVCLNLTIQARQRMQYKNERLGISFMYTRYGDDVEDPVRFCKYDSLVYSLKAYDSGLFGLSFLYPSSLHVSYNESDSSIYVGYPQIESNSAGNVFPVIRIYYTMETFEQIARREGFKHAALYGDTAKLWLSEGGRGSAQEAQSLEGSQWRGLRGMGEMGLFTNTGYTGPAPTLSSFLVSKIVDRTSIVCSYWNGPLSDNVDQAPELQFQLCEAQFYDFVASITFRANPKIIRGQ